MVGFPSTSPSNTVLGKNSVAQTVNTASTNILTAAKTKLAAASKALGLSMFANPYVLATAAVVGLGYGIYKLITYQTDAEKAQAKLNDAVKEYEKSSLSEQRELAKLKGELSGLTKGTDEYNAVKDKIVKGFGKYYSGLDTEIEKVGLTETAYNKLTDAINKSFGARQYEKFASEQQDNLSDTMANSLESIQKRLQGRLGDEYGTKIYAKIRDSIMKGSLSFGEKGYLDIQGIDAETKAALDKISGVSNNDFVINKAIEGYIRDIILASNMTDELDKKARVRFGVDNNPASDEKKGSEDAQRVEKKPGTEWLSFYKKAYEDAEKAYSDFLKSKKVMSDADRDKELKSLKELRDTAKTTYETKGGSTSSDTTKQESAADKLREQQEKLALLMDKQALEQSRSEQDLQNQVDQARIDAMADGFGKQQAQRDLNNKKEIQGLERQKDDYIRAIIQAEKEKFDTQEDVKAQQKKGYVKQDFDPSSVNVDTSKFDKIISNTETKQGVNEWQKREDAMNEYLLKYGTFTQKKEAIDKKYQDAIDKETNLGNKNALQKEWKEATANLDLSKLKQDINWEMIFGDLSKVTKEQLTNIKKQLSEFKKSDEFKNATPEQIQVIEGALNSINNAMVDKGGFFGGMTDSIKELKIATEELKKAEEELAEANKKGTEAQKEEAQKKVNQAQNKQQNAETNVTKSSDKTIQHLTSVGDAISQLGSTAEMSLSSFGSAVGNIVDAFSEAGKEIGGIIGAVFGILEGIQKQGIDGFIGTIFENIMGVAGSVWNTLTFGAFDALGLSGESDKTLEQDLERLSQSNEDLKIALDNLTERMEESSVADATETYEKQRDILLQRLVNTQESMKREGAAYSNGFLGIGGSHSSNVKIDESMSSSDWSRISEIVGHTVNSAGDFWKLTSEEMAKVAVEANGLYTNIKVHADDGYKNAGQYMDTYISYYKELEALENAWREKLTSASFDTIRDDFKSALMDMEADTEDFAKNFEELMKNAMFESLMTKKYDVMLQEWYKNFATAMDGGELTKNEQTDLKKQWDDIVNEGIAERDALYEMMGWDTSSSLQNQKEAMDSFVSQMGSAFTSLDVTAKDVSNSIYDYFRQAMISALYEKEYKSKMEWLYKSFENLSADGLSESDMSQLNSQIDQYINEMMKGVEGVNGLFADKLKDAEDIQSFVDNVKSAMSSIESTAEDVTDSIFEYIRQQMIDKMFADTFQPQIEAFYKKVQEAMSDGSVTDEERDALRNEADKLSEDIIAAKDILSDTLGTTEQNLKKEAAEEFNSFSDGILSSLYNAEVTAEAVAKNIAESMRNELIKAMYIEQYEPRIKSIWDKWKEYSSDGLVTDEERDNVGAAA